VSEGVQALAADVGPALEMLQHAPVSVDGAPVGVTLRPRDGEALSQLLQALGRRGLAVVPVGGGSQLGLGNLPRRIDALLSTERLCAAQPWDPAEGVLHAGAGERLGGLRARITAAGWELPLDAPDTSSVGGALAAATIGPRSLGFGAPRDAVLGLEVVLGSGERTHCGGRVVKNVTGYDLPRLYTGSLGSLCVIETAWLRLRPKPAALRTLELPERPTAEAVARGIDAARLSSARACALLGDARALRGVVELAGAVATLDRDAAWLAREHGARDAAADALDAVYAAQRQAPPGALRFRIPALPSEQAALLALLPASARVVVHPGLRLIYATTAEIPASSDEWRCEAAPPDAKRGRDVFAVPAGELALSRALKQRFDPLGVLSPGRFAGCF
jgi:glycolate oxidase FAD binding subunit